MDDDVIVCRCEEVSKKEIVDAVQDGLETINEVKKATRAGMGLCQGRTCSRTVRQLVAQGTGKEMSEIEPGRVRAPMRPIKLGVLASLGENASQ